MSLDGWVPVCVRESGIEWRLLPQHCFTHPFFTDTLLAHQGASRRVTAFEEAEQWVARNPGMTPSGLVFHMSRCGSTLVAQMHAALRGNRVMSEPPALDDVIRQESVARVRTILGALGQAAPGESRYFLKLDCWHIESFPLLRDILPGVPAVFLYRDPLEVIVSQMRDPGGWTVGSGADREAHLAGLFGRIMTAALSHACDLRFIDYTELPDAVQGMFGIEWSATEWELMQQASRRNAKHPNSLFLNDRRQKQESATPRAREAAAGIRALYESLRSASRAYGSITIGARQ